MLVFGLFHGFGLASKLQQFNLSPNGLVENIVSFNVGVEMGQLLALTAVLIGLAYWRARPGYLQHAYVTNGALMTAGFVFADYQLAEFVCRTHVAIADAPRVKSNLRLLLRFRILSVSRSML